MNALLSLVSGGRYINFAAVDSLQFHDHSGIPVYHSLVDRNSMDRNFLMDPVSMIKCSPLIESCNKKMRRTGRDKSLSSSLTSPVCGQASQLSNSMLTAQIGSTNKASRLKSARLETDGWSHLANEVETVRSFTNLNCVAVAPSSFMVRLLAPRSVSLQILARISARSSCIREVGSEAKVVLVSNALPARKMSKVLQQT